MNITCAQLLARIPAEYLPATDLIGQCEALAAAGHEADVAQVYRAWLDRNAQDGLAYAVRFNLGVLLTRIGDITGALQEYTQAVALKPDFHPALINLGTTCERLGSISDAVTHWLSVVRNLDRVNGEALTHKLTALKQIGRVLENTALEEAGEDALRQAIELAQPPDAIQHWIAIRQKQCKWPVLTRVENTTRTQLLRGMSPHCVVFHTDDPLLHLARGYQYYTNKIGIPELFFHHRHAERLAARPQRRIRVGYLSSYFKEHAHGYLTAELYRAHDRSRFEIFAYSCTRRTQDHIQQRIMRDVDHWVDILEMTDAQAAQRMFDDEIDILIDFNGYTGDARPGIVAMRPAPVIVAWLGYPGSMGTPYHHYIVADDFTIPADHELYYSEKVVRVPCYQPNDPHRRVSDRRWTRAEAGLPEDATVFCAFNGLPKITPVMWTRMMGILAQVPDSVLWMLDAANVANDRLRNAAAACGIDPARLVFAPKMPNEEHLARYPLADLFLDTSPCGAHTTASDALWMGVPVLTVAGRGFPSRVCGSLVTAAGLSELVCTSFDEYTAKAVAIGTDKQKQRYYRDLLAATRNTCDLFNLDKLVSALDDLMVRMWEDYAAGRNPVPNLVNMELYNQIGTDLDRDDVELIAEPGYLEHYRRALREIDLHNPVAADGRLWPGGA